MKGSKFQKLIIAALLIINVGLLMFLWMGKPPHPPKPGDTPRLASDIGLTGSVKEAIDKLELAHHKEKQILMKESGRLHKNLYEQIGAGKSTDNLLFDIHENQKQIEEMTFEFFNEVALKCDEEQLNALHEFIEHGLMRVGHIPPKH